MKVSKGLGVFAASIAILGAVTASTQPVAGLNESKAMANLTKLSNYSTTVGKIKKAAIPLPDWYKAQVAAEQAKANARPGAAPGIVTVTYTVGTKGQTRSNLDEFAIQAHQTLNDSRGWAQLGINFQRVDSGGSFHLILSEASQMPTFSSGCSAAWSCRVGVSVIINDDRWSSATDSWNAAGGGIRDYRHMVINHEVGHWLGHDHAGCSAAGSYAPVMLQQSIDLQGCKFNPWPLTSELSAPNLGR